ncbi:TonB-dependent receptor [Temperatibacter marinus]|uniref:TonB-dependent receptor n=1 Tax=Temperatibacter marinus TaxID=1456591 RepID=A0AA52HBE9_9PROT|nr:type IX secretion system membrane protein PorP/SprF [Temperatibacter marinus]WND03695.1 TonB-dependent receptor [Temperatibacter marinus]
MGTEKQTQNRKDGGLLKPVGFAVFAALAFTTPTFADTDDKKPAIKKVDEKSDNAETSQDSAKDLLNRLNLIIVRDKVLPSKGYALPSPDEKAAYGEPGLSLRVKGQKVGKNFVYLKDHSETDNGLFSYGNSLGFNSSRLGLIFSPKDKEKPFGTGFEVALQGSMHLTVNNTLGLSDLYKDREYSLGLSLGYSGFNVDASVLEQTSEIEQAYTGFGVGVSYSGSKLWARLGYKDMKADGYTVPSYIYDAVNTQVADKNSLELQAAYRLKSNWRLTGGVRYSIYGQPLYNLSAQPLEASQSFFIGTRWSF